MLYWIFYFHKLCTLVYSYTTCTVHVCIILIFGMYINAGGNNQKLKLFNLGKAISGDPIYKGTNQLLNPLINTGITKKRPLSNHVLLQQHYIYYSPPIRFLGKPTWTALSNLKINPPFPPQSQKINIISWYPYY